MDFTSMNFISIIWTREGMRKMIRSNRSTVIELPDTTSGIPLVLARPIKIQPGGNLEVPLECTRKLTNQMDIRIDAGFHHKNPNVYVMHQMQNSCGGSHVIHFNVTSTTMHMGTNQKAQQSCGSSTIRE